MKKLLLSIAFSLLLSGCDTSFHAPHPTPTLYPTYTLYPTRTEFPTITPNSTHALHPTATSAPTQTLIPTGVPTNAHRDTTVPTSTPLPTAMPDYTPTPYPTATSEPRLTIATPVNLARSEVPPLVLANYFPWYDTGTWDTGCTSSADRPYDGVYNSDDLVIISRHIEQARAAGLDGFAVHWFAQDNRTDANTSMILDAAPEGFDSTITFLYHILPGVKMDGVIEELRYVHQTYSEHPRFLRVMGRPVIFFADMYRVPDKGGRRPSSEQDVITALAHWEEIRRVVDPDRSAWWIAEGLRPEYLEVFDGLYVYRIDHACCPDAYLSAPRWAGEVRRWEEMVGLPKLWIGTVMPGWDDLNSANSKCADLRVSAEPFARDRGDGGYYARTWEAVISTSPDFVVVHSFNEWVEGSYIEPSKRLGDQYLRLTAQWVARFKAGS